MQRSDRGRAATIGRVVAAVDCGSNSTRLLVAERRPDGLRELRRRTRITRLGAGVDQTGRLTGAAIDRVAAVLEEYAALWRSDRATTVAVTATSAVRDAGDRRRFIDTVRQVTGATPVVLSGAQEAALTFRGAVPAGSDRRVVCDVGGGSTELVAGADGTPTHAVSLQLGSVRLRERYLADDPPTPAQYGALRMRIDSVLAGQPDSYAAPDGSPLLAVAGTAVTVGALVAGVSSSDVMHVDGMHVQRPQLAQVIEHLAWIPAARRLEHPAMVSGREDVIVAGAILLHRVLTRFRFTALQVRVADLLDGVALRAAEDRWPPDGDRPTTADHGMVEQRESHDDAR